MMMKWTVLSDNRSCDDSLETEHGLSILLETKKHRILLDTGASDVFIRNAERKGIDLCTVDYVFISHGHSDHAGGLRHLMCINEKAKVIISPHALSGKFFSKRGHLHNITTAWPEGNEGRMLMVDKTCEIADGLYVIAHIPHIHPMPKGNLHLFVQNKDGDYVNDDFLHELALYTEGLLFTGCAHSGLENILAACPYLVKTVVGGFHLLDDHETTEELIALGKRLINDYNSSPLKFPSPSGANGVFRAATECGCGPTEGRESPLSTVSGLGVRLSGEGLRFYTSHCTGDKCFATLKTVMGDKLQSFFCGTKVLLNKDIQLSEVVK